MLYNHFPYIHGVIYIGVLLISDMAVVPWVDLIRISIKSYVAWLQGTISHLELLPYLGHFIIFMSSTITWYNFCITLCSNTVVQCSLDSFRSFTWINASLVLWNAQRLFSTILLGDISQCWWFTSGCVWIASMCKCKLKQWEARYVRRFLGLIHHGCVICILLLESPWQVKWDVFGDLSKIQAL